MRRFLARVIRASWIPRLSFRATGAHQRPRVERNIGSTNIRTREFAVRVKGVGMKYVQKTVICVALPAASCGGPEASPPILSIAPTSNLLSFGVDREPRVLTILNAGGQRLEWKLQCTGEVGGVSWLSCDQTQGVIEKEAQVVTVSVNRIGLAVDDYRGDLVFTSNGGSKSISVTMTVADCDAGIAIRPTSIDFGTIDAASEAIITLQGTGSRCTADWTIRVSDLAQSWLSVSETSGTVAPMQEKQIFVTARPGSAPRYGSIDGSLIVRDGRTESTVTAAATVVGTCAADGNCAIPGSFCDRTSMQCRPQNALGASCQRSIQCAGTSTAAGHCIDGVCCDSACDGPCRQCNSEGRCVLSTVGSIDALCGQPSTCNPATCNALGVCELTRAGSAGCDSSDACKTCNGRGQCTNEIIEERHCLVEGQCASEGAQRSPSEPCRVCIPQTSQTEWTNRAVGAPCHDGDWCTVLDQCDPVGLCLGTDRQLDEQQRPRDDGVACTQDTCDAANRQFIHLPVAARCDFGDYCRTNPRCDASQGCQYNTRATSDGNDCTEDTCDEALDRVISTPRPGWACDDGDWCTLLDRCDSTGACGGAPRTIDSQLQPLDDGVACTEDRCDATLMQFVHQPNHLACDRGRFCEINPRCNAAVGCEYDPRPSDDAIPCTVDSCNEAARRVDNIADDGRCNDGRWCTMTDQCSPTSTVADANGCTFVARTVEDDVACTDDRCDEATQSIRHDPIHSRCQDGLFCTVNERCDPADRLANAAGCLSDTRPVDDSVPCTVDTCNEQSGRVDNIPSDARCDDNRWCTISDSCVPTSTGADSDGCLFIDRPAGDSVACTRDSCSEAGQTLLHSPDDAACSAFSACAAGTCDPNGGCGYTPFSNWCLIDNACVPQGTARADNPCLACDPVADASDWSPVLNGTSCGDQQACTFSDSCQAGVCQGTSYSCDDGLGCTNDACNGDGSCRNSIQSGWCVINGNTCVAANELDETGCRACLPALDTQGWSNTNEGMSCDDASACTVSDTCLLGSCVGTYSCDDGLACTTDSCAPATGCINTLNPDSCLIGGVCRPQGEAEPGNTCRACISATSSQSWSSTRENLACDDQNSCSHTDRCQAGSCTGTIYTCDDGIACTDNICGGNGSCTYPVHAGRCLITGQCYGEGTADPANPCRECLTGVSQDSWTNDNTNPCVDGNLCTHSDTCSEGSCIGTPYSCDDGRSCTLDQCDGLAGCTNDLEAGNCLIGGACYAQDDTNPANDCLFCQPSITPTGWTNHDSVLCDDSNIDTTGEYCANGRCIGVGRVPDTGSSFCTNGGGATTCPLPGQPYFGQDAHYSIHASSYDEIVTGSGVFHDRNTGLFWYSDPSRFNRNWASSDSYCASISVGGRSWRLPTVGEATLVLYGSPQQNSCLRIGYSQACANFWTQSISAAAASERWLVQNYECDTISSFYCGAIQRRSSANQYSVNQLCVSGVGYTSETFDTSVAGVVLDRGRNLMWERVSPVSEFTWQDALSRCQSLSLSGFSDWRLPTFKELLTIVDYGRAAPAADSTVFPSIVSDLYWSATPATLRAYVWDNRLVQYVTFSDGRSNVTGNANVHHTRCVRSVPEPP